MRAHIGKTHLGALALAALAAAGCSDKLNVANYGSVTTDAASKDPQSLQFLATGILSSYRGSASGYNTSTGIFGREALSYSTTEGRNHSHAVVGPGPLDPSGFAVGNFGYGNMRNVFNFLQTVENAPLTPAEKEASRGFAKTIEAAELLRIIATRDTIGAVVEIKESATELAPFVSRDSTYKYLAGRLDEAKAHLAAGGAAFPFALHSGFSSAIAGATFDTPAGYLKFNRALYARVQTYRARIGCGVPCYQAALAAIDNESFISLSASALQTGPKHVYSTASGDATNGQSLPGAADLFAHPSIWTDAPLRANGTRDLRLVAKVDTLNLPASSARFPAGGAAVGISTTSKYKAWPARDTPLAIIRNEELILLRAEARWFTGNKTGAISDIDFIRVNSGGLAPSSLTTASSDDQFVTELLLQRRYSLMLEGHRWVDHRQFNRLGQLPLDLPNHWVAKVQPIPQGECLQRNTQATPDMRGPGCP